MGSLPSIEPNNTGGVGSYQTRVKELPAVAVLVQADIVVDGGARPVSPYVLQLREPRGLRFDCESLECRTSVLMSHWNVARQY